MNKSKTERKHVCVTITKQDHERLSHMAGAFMSVRADTVQRLQKPVCLAQVRPGFRGHLSVGSSVRPKR